ncbi:MAG: dTDP-4-dehydrorhamnose 3,5-epimerase family protein [Candidatus Odinarchaeota archaeon]
MKILSIENLVIPEIKIIKFARFRDQRGYFTEQFRKSDLLTGQKISSLEQVEFVQANESFSKKGVIRGLHFQWNPYMGKLVRTVEGYMVDLALDIRKNSPTYGKIIAYDMPASAIDEYGTWIWVPPGFAHGNFFIQDTFIEYFCTGEYSPGCEAGISPIAEDFDWSLVNKDLKRKFDDIIDSEAIMTEKDRNGLTLDEWNKDERSNEFIYGKLKNLGLF